MSQHRGEVLENIIRRSGYSIKTLAERLGVSRNTVYNKFKEHNLSYEFIMQVGDVIHYDFTYDYPEMSTIVSGEVNEYAAELWRTEQKYTRLLEHYNKLLGFLVRVTSNSELEPFRHEIERFLKRFS